MTYNLKSLNVASLDFENIMDSLTSFLEVQPGLTDISFRDQASTANLLLRTLATATAYNGVYAQFGFTESFLSTATLLESIVSIASNHSVLVPLTQSASARVVTTSAMDDYTGFAATSTSGANLRFYLYNETSGASAAVETYLYSGSSVATFSNYDHVSQSIILPYNIDPNTISFYVIPNSLNKAEKIKWTRVSKGNTTTSTNNNFFTVTHGSNGYLVTNNFANAATVPTSKSVIVRAIVSNGKAGNGGTIVDPTGLLSIIGSASGGYDTISVDTARAKVLFNANGQDRCVTLKDFEKAILSSSITGTSDSTLIAVRNGDTPGTVNVYVTGLSSANQTLLVDYLQSRTVAGIGVVYAI
jgi:hypothetical protein